MKSTTLIETNDPKLIVRGYDLGHKIASNLAQVFTRSDLEYFEQNLGEIRNGLIRFVNRQLEVPQLLETPAFPTSDTDLFSQLSKAEDFAQKHLGVSVRLNEIFQIPQTIPWKSVLPVFVPAGFDNRKGFKLLRKLGFDPWESVDVSQYSGSTAFDQHQLFLIQNSERPDKDTMGLSPNQLRKTGNPFLNLKGYAIAMGFHHQLTKGYLDPETLTWFPEDRLSDGKVAYGYWNPWNLGVGFCWNDPDCEDALGGARLAISVSLKT